MDTEKRCVARERKSGFVEIFRTTPTDTVCPNFYVLSHANGCMFEPHCSYCYLKSSFRNLPAQQVFTNVDKMLDDIRRWLKRDNLESFMLNTGNLSDSLNFEEIRPVVRRLVELFRVEAEAKGRRHSLLLVTKGGLKECRPLLKLKPCRNVVVSFSVNHPEAARKFEAGAAAVSDRMEAARKLKHAGWRVRLRMDPMILGYDYREVAAQVRDLGPERVTLGTLRAEKSLPRYIENGLFDELEKTPEPKRISRYPREQRLALYRDVIDVLGKGISIGLCEETPDIWNALGLDTEGKSCNCCA